MDYEHFKNDLKGLSDKDLETLLGIQNIKAWEPTVAVPLHDWFLEAVQCFKTMEECYCVPPFTWDSDLQEELFLENERRVAKKTEELAEAWKVRWPRHCTKCFGSGGFVFYQSHPYGMGSASEQMFDACEGDEAHQEITCCHRCGQEGLDEDNEKPCTFCGWNYGQGANDVMPRYF